MAREFDARSTRFGKTLDQFEVGDIFRHWPGKTITEADDHLFSLLTLAASPLHIDANYAEKNMPNGRNIVIGTYIYSLLTGMSVPDISGRAIASLGVHYLQHTAPMYHGDTLYGFTEVLAKRLSVTNPEQGILTTKTTGINQKDEIVCTFERSILLPVAEVTS